MTVDEFALVVPLFEQAFQDHMRHWRLDGKPRTKRTYTTYKKCPLPLPADRLFFILVYLKTNPLQVAHGLLFGLHHGKTNQWIHLLLPLLRQTLRDSGHAPARTLDALAQRLGLAEPALHAATPPFLSRWHRAANLPPQSCSATEKLL